MKTIKWSFLLLAFLTIAGLVGIGVGLGESSGLIISLSIIVAISAAGTGFILGKKVNEQEQA